MNRSWNISCWNVRGINAAEKWPLIRNKIEENNCEIFCFQETKKEYFDSAFIRNFAPRRFDKFIYAPSTGASGGILVCWNGSLFDGSVVDIQSFAISVSFSSRHDLNVWNLVNVYGPCTEPARSKFVLWMKNLNIQYGENWILLGDFNFYR
jgi:exonuclease III